MSIFGLFGLLKYTMTYSPSKEKAFPQAFMEKYRVYAETEKIVGQ